jgi:hypothetical protein
MNTLEREFRLKRIATEAESLSAPELRQVLRATWSLWLAEREATAGLAGQLGVEVEMEVQGAFPLELAARLKAKAQGA